MKKFFLVLHEHIHWLIYLLLCDAFFVGMLWVVDARSLVTLSLALVLFTILSFAAVCAFLWGREKRIARAFSDYLQDPEKAKAEILVSRHRGFSKERMKVLLNLLEKNETQKSTLISQNEEYEEYVEKWAHEAKTPIALLTMILDNNRDTMPPEMAYKIEFIRSNLSESVEQMLQYARVKGERKDYLFEKLSLKEAVDEVIEDYRPLLSEKNFTVINELGVELVFSDRRALHFILGQIVSNAIKYSSEDPQLKFAPEGPDKLVISDNGIGVKQCDLPYIFERGFTGDTGAVRKKATGMGLYLVKKMADDMKFSLDVASETGKGFQIVVQYPMVEF